MVLLTSCCCWKSVRSGSLACGVYTLIFYIVVLTASSVHIHTIHEVPVLLAFTIIMVALAGFCVVSSIILIIGICSNNRILLLPWMCAVALTTLLDVILSVYLILDSIYDGFLAIIFVTDLLICALNVYCLLCVLSLYQSYQNRDPAQDDIAHQVQFMQVPGGGGGNNRMHFLSVPKFSTQVTEDCGSTAISSAPSFQQRLSVSRSGLYPELRTIVEERRRQAGFSEATLMPVESRSASPSSDRPQSPQPSLTSPITHSVPLLVVAMTGDQIQESSPDSDRDSRDGRVEEDRRDNNVGCLGQMNDTLPLLGTGKDLET